MPAKDWPAHKLILFWIVTIGQVWIVTRILTRPFPVQPEAKSYFVAVTTVIMIAESAIVMLIAMLVITWRWFHASRNKAPTGG